MAKLSLFRTEWKKHILTGQIISETGVFHVSSGGDTEFLPIIVMNAEKPL